MDGGISAVGSIFNASWKIATVVYELKAVGEQTRDLLDTTSQVSSTLQHAHILRRQRSGLLNVTEKRWIDDVLQASDRAVGNVAALIEPARVDMQTQCKKIRFFTRGQFILRDSPKVQVQLGRLGIAAQGLNTAMGVLCNREGTTTAPISDGGALRKVDSSAANENEPRPPPSYEVVELLDRRRESMLKRRASKLPLNLPMNLDEELSRVRPLEEDPQSLPMVSINVAEVQPTPVTSPQPNRYAEEDDGLQVVENYWGSNPCVSSSPDPQSRGPSPWRPYSNLSASSGSTSPYQHHQSISPHLPPAIPGFDSSSGYLPYRAPAPPPPPPAQHQQYAPSWQQPPRYNYPPPPPTPIYNYPPPAPPPPMQTSNSYPRYRAPAPPAPTMVDAQSPRPPYHSYSASQPQLPTITYNHQHHPAPPHNHHLQSSHPYPSPPPPISTSSPNPNLPPTPTRTTSSNYYCHSPDTISTTASTSSASTSRSPNLTRQPSYSSILTSTTTEDFSALPQQPRQKGRARGRAWLEHQSER